MALLSVGFLTSLGYIIYQRRRATGLHLAKTMRHPTTEIGHSEPQTVYYNSCGELKANIGEDSMYEGLKQNSSQVDTNQTVYEDLGK